MTFRGIAYGVFWKDELQLLVQAGLVFFFLYRAAGVVDPPPWAVTLARLLLLLAFARTCLILRRSKATR